MWSYFFIFRVGEDGVFDFEEPTGGLVVETARNSHGTMFTDFKVIRGVVKQRFHCRPDEELIIAEVFEPEHQHMAAHLHEAWELEQRSFLELMQT